MTLEERLDADLRESPTGDLPSVGRLHALDAGTELWAADTIVDHDLPYSSTGAVYIAGNLAVIGNSGADMDKGGVRGYVSAYDVETGRLAWRCGKIIWSRSDQNTTNRVRQAAAGLGPRRRATRWSAASSGTRSSPSASSPASCTRSARTSRTSGTPSPATRCTAARARRSPGSTAASTTAWSTCGRSGSSPAGGTPTWSPSAPPDLGSAPTSAPQWR